MQEPTLDFSCAEHAEDWAERLEGSLLASGSLRRRDGNPALLEGYDEGKWWVQDAAAAVPALILEKVSGALNGKTVIDLCAAPGGKTAQLVAKGANVTAIDSSAERLKTLHANMKRLKMAAHVVTADGTTYTPEAPVDAVLLDATFVQQQGHYGADPISFVMTKLILKTLNKAQKDLLYAAATWLKPGGVLVYATCSILKAEGEAILASLPKGMTIHQVQADDIDGIELTIDEHGFARIMPNAIKTNEAKIMSKDMDSTDDIPQGNDGFFIACLTKI